MGQPWTSLQCHFIQSYIGWKRVCLAVTCYPHFRQNNRVLWLQQLESALPLATHLNENLSEVEAWLEEMEAELRAQGQPGNNLEEVKKQHDHLRVGMVIELDSWSVASDFVLNVGCCCCFFVVFGGVLFVVFLLLFCLSCSSCFCSCFL